MAEAIGSVANASATAIAAAGGATAGFDPQLARVEAQLADWLTCPSRNTPDGKAKIRELTDRIGAIKQRLRSAEIQAQIRRPAAASPRGAAPAAAPAASASPTRSAQAAATPLGSRINIFV